jgi:ribosomal protein L40E
MFCGEKASTGWACPRCSAANPAAALFCMNCGGRRESGPPA